MAFAVTLWWSHMVWDGFCGDLVVVSDGWDGFFSDLMVVSDSGIFCLIFSLPPPPPLLL